MADAKPRILHLRADAASPPGFPRFSGNPGPAKLISIAQALKPYDLIVSHGWDAINIAMAHKVFGQHLALPPLIHHEPGSADFAEQEGRLKRKIIRRIALGSVDTLIAEVSGISEFAQKHWNIPASRIRTIAPGIDLKRYRPTAKPDALPGLVKRATESWIGAYLTEANEAAVTELVMTLRELPRDWQLVLIAGDTSTHAIRAVADQAGLSHRVHVLGSAADEAKALALCDIYVELAGAFEPASGTMKAMAAATPVIAAQTEDVLSRFDLLIEDRDTRKREGAANRETALARFGVDASASAVEALYSAVIGSK